MLTYLTRESLKRALDQNHTARNDDKVDRAIEQASRSVERDLRRRFYPQTATRRFVRPSIGVLFPVYEAGADLVSVTSLTVDGSAVSVSDYDLLPEYGPPYNRIRFDSVVSFSSIDRRPVSITGVWGYDDQRQTVGTLAAGIDAVTTTVDVSNSAGIGVGSLLTVGTERLIVAARAMLTTGQTLQVALSDASRDVTVEVANGAAYAVDEVILIDSERMLIVDVAGNQLTVKRSWDGSVLDSHDPGVTIYAPRRLTVERAALGTTAATHALAATVQRQLYPGPVVAYTMALAMSQLLGETAGYTAADAAQISASLEQVRSDARRAYGRILLA